MRILTALRTVAFATAVAAPMALAAQGATSEQLAWVGTTSDVPLTDRVSATLDVQARVPAASPTLRQLLVRPGVSYRLGSRVRLVAGYANMYTQPTGATADTGALEHRFWQMVQVDQRVGPVALVNRARLEQRFVGLLARTSAGRTERVGAPERSQRLRYQVRATAPLPGRPFDGRLTASLNEELLFGFGGAAGDLSFDQNRVAASLGFRLNAGIRLEGGYLRQTFLQSLRVEHVNHVLQLGLTTSGLPGR